MLKYDKSVTIYLFLFIPLLINANVATTDSSTTSSNLDVTTNSVYNSTWCTANFNTATIEQLCACGVTTCCEPGKCYHRTTQPETTTPLQTTTIATTTNPFITTNSSKSIKGLIIII